MIHDDRFLIERRRLVIEFRSAGRLVPWLGPAFRGITALRYRAAVCQKPVHQWRTTWRYCRGCEHIAPCGSPPLPVTSSGRAEACQAKS